MPGTEMLEGNTGMQNREKLEVMVEGELSPDTQSDLVELIEKNAEGF